MPPTIDMEREFFRAANNIETCHEVKKQFLARINKLSDKWIDNKFRMGVFYTLL